MKFSRLLAGVGLAVLVGTAGTACTTHAGAAAQVGSQSIETAQLRGIVDRGLAAADGVPAAQTGQTATAPLNRLDLQRRTLTTLVQLHLLAGEADRRGVTLSSGAIASYYQAYAVLQFGSVPAFERRAAAAGFAPRDVSLIVRSGALESALSDRVSPHLLATEAETREQYNSIVDQVGRIPLTYAQAKPYLARFIVSQERSVKLRPVLAQAEKKDPISINPRFGTWNTGQFAVIAADGSIASRPAPTPTVDLTAQS
ncbi:SurA N-terminal domain-containing protein [Frankia sp. AiPs1]|uniref:SurA N-terminal domain-containing protein n=1 Tax=Frankia sp. AiPs1 TaxID=573493 RepID=UPI002044BC3D|nr:SurA N-terminal domain-containing protein [Frankia sp. AiPs1]MCM3924406.1 SurA N-terminal domain-containing protein [Frankia sp. AiPs1]